MDEPQQSSLTLGSLPLLPDHASLDWAAAGPGEPGCGVVREAAYLRSVDGIGFRAARVVAPSGRVGWTVVDAAGAAVAPAEAFLRYRFACEASPNTLRAYAHDLKLFFGFLAERSLSWRELSPAELGEFAAWLRRPAGNVILLPGTPPARAASTVNRARSGVMAFYDFHRLQGVELADLMLDRRRGGRGA